MKCWSRSTFGVVIGILNILIYILVTLGFMSMFTSPGYNADHQDPDRRTIILCTILSVFLIMIIISGVLIMGIVKRQHKLMIPWLIVSFLGFVSDCVRVIITVIMGMVNGVSFSLIIYVFFFSLVRCGIEALVLWPIYTLWRDIRIKNEEKSERIMGDDVHYESGPPPPPEYNFYSSLPLKS